jgi:Alginate export
MNHSQGKLQLANHSIPLTNLAAFDERRLLLLALLSFALGPLLASPAAVAQQSALNPQSLVYSDYPQPQGRVQPFQFSAMPRWVSIDFQVRAREENQSSYKYISGNDAVYALTRVWGGLEIRPSQQFTAYLQFVDAHGLGLPLANVAPNMRDAFDARQAFLAWHPRLFEIIAGRQELRYGSERLVGISNWTDTSRTWDGFLGRIGDKNRLDLFSTSVVSIHPTSHDTHGAGLTFHGAVATITTWVPHTVVSPFVLIKALPRVDSLQSIFGTETEVTPGAEVSAKFPVRVYFDTFVALQRGSYSNDSVRAAANYIKAGYYADNLLWKPRLAGEYDYASGNPKTDPHRIGTFDQLYPSNHNVFGLTDLFGYQNIKQERINLDLAPAKPLALLIQQESLQVSTRLDNVYCSSAMTRVKAPAGGFLSSDIGREFDAAGQYAFLGKNNMTLNVGVGHFSPGTLMRQNSHGAPLTLAYFGLTYKFKVNHKPDNR